jgi:hypothetical protein
MLRLLIVSIGRVDFFVFILKCFHKPFASQDMLNIHFAILHPMFKLVALSL